MFRQLFALIISMFTLVPFTAVAKESTPLKSDQTDLNQVYVKIIMPTEEVDEEKASLVVESWIAKDLTRLGQDKFTAVTGWVPLDLSPLEATDLWDGGRLDGALYCPVFADIPERADGQIKILLVGWTPGGAHATASLTDEPGSRLIVPVKQSETEKGMPYVAVFIGPPSK